MFCVGVLSEFLDIRKDRQFKYNVTLGYVRVTILTSGKVISITYFEFVFVALIIQHSNRVRRFILVSVACLAIPYISTLLHK